MKKTLHNNRQDINMSVYEEIFVFKSVFDQRGINILWTSKVMFSLS